MIIIASILSVSMPLVWCGMIAAISFIEAPLKFRAPGVTLPLGLGIGKLVFHALNRAECIFFIVWIITSFISRTAYYDGKTNIAAFRDNMIPPLLVGAILSADTFWLLPRLDFRATRIREGKQPTGQSLHLYYAAGEIVKFILLAATGLIQLFQIIKTAKV